MASGIGNSLKLFDKRPEDTDFSFGLIDEQILTERRIGDGIDLVTASSITFLALIDLRRETSSLVRSEDRNAWVLRPAVRISRTWCGLPCYGP